MTATEFEMLIQRKVVRGQTRHEAEELLKCLDVEFAFFPRERFFEDSLIYQLEPPDDSTGALAGVSKVLEKAAFFERFVGVVIYLGDDDRVLKAASKSITAGP